MAWDWMGNVTETVGGALDTALDTSLDVAGDSFSGLMNYASGHVSIPDISWVPSLAGQGLRSAYGAAASAAGVAQSSIGNIDWSPNFGQYAGNFVPRRNPFAGINWTPDLGGGLESMLRDLMGPSLATGSWLPNYGSPRTPDFSFLDISKPKNPADVVNPGQQGPQGPYSGTMGNPADGQGYNSKPWSQVNRWNDLIARAIAQVQSEEGVAPPANRVKAHMMIESEGVPCANDQPYTRGLMQMTIQPNGAPNTYFAADWNRLGCSGGQPVDVYYQIYAGVKELAMRYKAAENTNPDKWVGASCSFFSGNFACGNAVDSYNGTTEGQYRTALEQYINLLNGSTQQTVSGGGQPGATPTAGGAPSALATIWGNSSAAHESQPFGVTDFSQQNCGEGQLYGYGAAVGCPCCHPGFDVGMPRGTPLYSPVSGTVVAAGGTGHYCDVMQNGCGPGVGQLTIRLDNGDEVTLGHMQAVTVPVGFRVSPGTPVGSSGGENGEHVHVEARTPSGSTSSGQQVIDPRIYFGGGYVAPTGGATPGTGYTPQPAKPWWETW